MASIEKISGAKTNAFRVDYFGLMVRILNIKEVVCPIQDIRHLYSRLLMMKILKCPSNVICKCLWFCAIYIMHCNSFSAKVCVRDCSKGDEHTPAQISIIITQLLICFICQIKDILRNLVKIELIFNTINSRVPL